MSARTSQTPFILLGMLSRAPMSGYELRHAIERSVGSFWQESFGQIYPALKQLEAEGLIRAHTARDALGPERRVFSLLEAGHARLRQWLEQPPMEPPPRNALLAKLFFGGLSSQEVLRGHLLAQRQRLQRRLALHQDVLDPPSSHPDAQQRLERLIRHHDERMARAELQWCEEMLAELAPAPKE